MRPARRLRAFSEYKMGLVSDMQPPSAPPPMHPAPPEQWRPLSGLAVTAFVLSLVLIIVALMGLWLAEAVPLVLGIFALSSVKRRQRRGRVLAVWAIAIAIGVGSCSYMMHSGTRQILADTAESLLSILSSKSSTEDKTKELRSWTWPQALEKEDALPATWMQRYDGVVVTYGAWLERFELPSLITGFTPMLAPPKGVVEIGTDDVEPPEWPPWAAFWVAAVFEKGIVHVAVVFKGGDKEAATSVTELRPGQQHAVIGDIRFFRPKAEKTP